MVQCKKCRKHITLDFPKEGVPDDQQPKGWVKVEYTDPPSETWYPFCPDTCVPADGKVE